MKKLFFIFELLILTSFAGIAQTNTGLELRNYNTNNSKFISEGSKIQAIKDGKTYKGNLKVISDKSICINSDTLLLSQIQEISAKTFSRQLGGAALLVPSSFVGGFGLWAVAMGLASSDGYGIIVVVFGTPVAAAGILGVYIGAKLIFKGRKFNPSRWEYRVAETQSKLHQN